MMRSTASCLLVALALGSPAAARPLATTDAVARGPSDPARDLAARRFHDGSAEYADGDWAAALADFEAGYAAKPSPPFLVNIGQCLRKLDRLDEAVIAYRKFLDTRYGTPAVRMEVLDALDDTLAELNRRIDSLAGSAALFRAFLASGDGDAELRTRARATMDDILKELARIDDGLAAGYGVGRAIVIPRGSPSVRAEAIRQRLAAMAATSRPTASTTSHRSPRSASHSHIAR